MLFKRTFLKDAPNHCTGFVPLTQDSSIFFERVAVHEWEATTDNFEEGKRITQTIQAHEGCKVLMMPNHGCVTQCKAPVAELCWSLGFKLSTMRVLHHAESFVFTACVHACVDILLQKVLCDGRYY